MAEDNARALYEGLLLDLNLDHDTAEEAWKNYLECSSKFTLEGEQLTWLACSLYAACSQRSVPTVGSPDNVIQGNCVSLTRILQYCKLSFMEFLQKVKSWFEMSNFDEAFCQKVDLLERNFAVSNNIFKKYKPIFLDLFTDPSKDRPRPPRSRKQRRLACNSKELFVFGWNLYTLIKGKYKNIPQDLVICYALLLSCIDSLYMNVVRSGRTDLLNPQCKGFPKGLLDKESSELSSWPESIMSYLCQKFDGVHLDTIEVRDYHWKPKIMDLISNKILIGTSDGTGLIEQNNFDHNIKNVGNAYEEHLLSSGEFNEQMFLEDAAEVVRGAPSGSLQNVTTSTANSLLRQPWSTLPPTFGIEGDHHLVKHTPITGRVYTNNRPAVPEGTPVTIVTNILRNFYTLVNGRKASPSEDLQTIFSGLSENPEERIDTLLEELGGNFKELYTKSTQSHHGISERDAETRIQRTKTLFYTFLEHILMDEKKRNTDLGGLLKQDVFFRALFICCLEIVLVSYNDPRKFPWSLQVGKVRPYHFIRIIEPVIRSEKQSSNQLCRELVKHLKWIEEQILDTLAWRSDSPLWEALSSSGLGVPTCQDVNYSDQLESDVANIPMTTMLSPRFNPQPTQSPISALSDTFQSPRPLNMSARRTLFSGASGNSAALVTSDETNGIHIPSQPEPSIATPALVFTSPPDVSKKKEKPKRSGSLAIFFRKFYTLANMRLGELCNRLGITDLSLKRKMWTCFEHSVIYYTELLKDRHMDQMVMCVIYILFKVTKTDRSFQEIMQHYRKQPQAASHIYRSVLIRRANPSANNPMNPNQHIPDPQKTPSHMIGTSTNFETEERGDIIKFYNDVYREKIKHFAIKFNPRPSQEADLPPLSPLPINRPFTSSPRRRVSSNNHVYINSLSNKLSPREGDTGDLAIDPRKPDPAYIFNRSPAKTLSKINSRINPRPSNSQSKRCLDLSFPSTANIKRKKFISELSPTTSLDANGENETILSDQIGHREVPSTQINRHQNGSEDISNGSNTS